MASQASGQQTCCNALIVCKRSLSDGGQFKTNSHPVMCDSAMGDSANLGKIYI